VNLQDATRVARIDQNFKAAIDPEWCVWGPVGGYVAAIALRTIGLVAPANHRPVTLSCQFLAKGNPGEVDVMVEPLKVGSTSFFNVRLVQGSEIFLQAQICTTAKIDGPDQVGVTPPDVPGPAALEPFAAQLERFGHTPIAFWKNVDGRQVDFRPPGDPDPRGCRTECWMRFEDWQTTSDPFLDGARALILIDTNIWRAYNRGQSELPKHVAPSLDLTVWFHEAVPDSPWQLVEAQADLARRALLNGSARVWSKEGRPIASGGGHCLFVPIRTQ
jgi:acyl-CoA thioesterase II